MFAGYLDQAYAAARNGAVQVDGQNVFVYRGGSPADDVEVEFGVGVTAPFPPVGVGVTAPFPPAGPVQYSELPSGEVATATHWGDYGRLGEAHAAVIAWCQAHGRELAGPRWEVYGHWSPGAAPPRTDVYHLLAR